MATGFSAAGVPHILIIEDELLIALMIEEMVRAAGYRVAGVAHTVAMVREQIAKRDFNAVLLDVDIEGQHDPQMVDRLLEAGVKVAFVTGYDYILEPRHEKVPTLQSLSQTASYRIC